MKTRGWYRSFSAFAVAAAMAMAMGTSMSGCDTATSDKDLVFIEPDKGLELVGEHKTLLGMGEVKKGVWVDPRTELEFSKGHIPGAINIPYQHITRDNYLLKDYDIIVVYGNDYNDAKASGMSKKLMELGFKKVNTLNGGVRAWKQAGYQLENSSGEAVANAPES